MRLKIEELDDPCRFRQILKVPYDELISFILDYLRRRTNLMVFFWSVCLLFLGLALMIRIDIAGYFPLKKLFFHSFLGLVVLPLLIIPFH